ncbi:hypothetical protein SAMN05216302_10913 [Nitrosomonas aestuarii]|uniref:Lipoprotein n=1 Tax=Nitrosomonas aestuarii TaxID=52441 RepID=A0A1I4HNP2_9PROT|nr:hypothetical protein [Nitrosomonas aestuarii]SFL43171.1 hypothetical protein SAMN05216302_10913 [Nitrosomonas aestuarii]
MKSIKVLIVSISAFSILILTGCEPTDGEVKLKEPRKELSDMPERKNWLEMDITKESTDE